MADTTSTARRSDRKLTPAEARRALYIDFEGRKVGPPALLGCTRRSKVDGETSVWQAVTNPDFGTLAEADRIESLALADAVERILQRAESGNRRIVAWSEHELKMVREFCPQHLERFTDRYVNARSLAERWRSKCHVGPKPKPAKLTSYLELIKYRVPEAAGPDRVGPTLKIIGEAMDRGKRADQLTDKQRQRWADLREHNRHDCVGMRRVCVLAADEIAAADERTVRSLPTAPRPSRRRRPARTAPTKSIDLEQLRDFVIDLARANRAEGIRVSMVGHVLRGSDGSVTRALVNRLELPHDGVMRGVPYQSLADAIREVTKTPPLRLEDGLITLAR